MYVMSVQVAGCLVKLHPGVAYQLLETWFPNVTGMSTVGASSRQHGAAEQQQLVVSMLDCDSKPQLLMCPPGWLDAARRLSMWKHCWVLA